MSERDVVESEAGLVFFHELNRLVDPEKDTEALCRVLDMRPSDETFYAARVIRAQADEITSLRAVVERLPVTADGVRVVHGDVVWVVHPRTGHAMPSRGTGNERGECIAYIGDPSGQSYRLVGECYSTQAAAEAAREGE